MEHHIALLDTNISMHKKTCSVNFVYSGKDIDFELYNLSLHSTKLWNNTNLTGYKVL